MTIRRNLPLGLLLALAAAGTGCGGSEEPASPALPLEVEYAGCQQVLVPGLVCILTEERTLDLWVAAPVGAPVELRAGGRRLEAAGDPVLDGQLFTVQVPDGVAAVEVQVDSRDGRRRWELAVSASGDAAAGGREAETGDLPRRDLLAETKPGAGRKLFDLIHGYRFAEARQVLDGLALPPEAPAEARYLMAYFRGLLATVEGDHRTALAELARTMEIAERVGMRQYLWTAEQMHANLLLGLGRYREAAEQFDGLALNPHFGKPCDEPQLLNNRAWAALLTREVGEVAADPTDLLEEALVKYERDKDERGCEANKRFNVLLNLALAHLQAGRLLDAQRFLDQAQQLEGDATPHQRLWWLDLQARIALADERPREALSLFEELETIAGDTASVDGRLRAALGRALCAEALGDRATALAALEAAEDLLDEQSLRIPVHEGRETFVAKRQAISSLHLELLLAAGRADEALAAARRARARVLRQMDYGDRLASLPPERRAEWNRLMGEYHAGRRRLEEEEEGDWRLPADRLGQVHSARGAADEELQSLLDRAFSVVGDPAVGPADALAPPRDGELLLAYHPLPSGWVAFAADGRTVGEHRFELPEEVLEQPGELAERLLVPFRDRIEGARRIRILPYGPLREVDFHALPFAGDVLVAGRPVVYGLDLQARAQPARPPGRRALLVADPRDDLPGTRQEAGAVRAALQAQAPPWVVADLASAAATPEAVLHGLAGSDLLHYAGHGTFGGFGGWESGLLLAEPTRLTVSDLFALPRAPAWVVLSGCETGLASAEAPVEGLGLAQVFLLAGSSAVVASVRPVEDRSTLLFVHELYRRWDGEGDPAAALQGAQLAWRREVPKSDWASFRVFER